MCFHICFVAVDVQEASSAIADSCMETIPPVGSSSLVSMASLPGSSSSASRSVPRGSSYVETVPL